MPGTQPRRGAVLLELRHRAAPVVPAVRRRDRLGRPLLRAVRCDAGHGGPRARRALRRATPGHGDVLRSRRLDRDVARAGSGGSARRHRRVPGRVPPRHPALRRLPRALPGRRHPGLLRLSAGPRGRCRTGGARGARDRARGAAAARGGRRTAPGSARRHRDRAGGGRRPDRRRRSGAEGGAGRDAEPRRPAAGRGGRERGGHRRDHPAPGRAAVRVRGAGGAVAEGLRHAGVRLSRARRVGGREPLRGHPQHGAGAAGGPRRGAGDASRALGARGRRTRPGGGAVGRGGDGQVTPRAGADGHPGRPAARAPALPVLASPRAQRALPAVEPDRAPRALRPAGRRAGQAAQARGVPRSAAATARRDGAPGRGAAVDPDRGRVPGAQPEPAAAQGAHAGGDHGDAGTRGAARAAGPAGRGHALDRPDVARAGADDRGLGAGRAGAGDRHHSARRDRCLERRAPPLPAGGDDPDGDRRTGRLRGAGGGGAAARAGPARPMPGATRPTSRRSRWAGWSPATARGWCRTSRAVPTCPRRWWNASSPAPAGSRCSSRS